MNEADLIQSQDQQRTARAFVGFLSTALGVDQALPQTDGSAYNAPGQYQVVNSQTGMVGVEGRPVSTGQAVRIPVPLLVGGLLLVLLVASGHLKV